MLPAGVFAPRSNLNCETFLQQTWLFRRGLCRAGLYPWRVERSLSENDQRFCPYRAQYVRHDP